MARLYDKLLVTVGNNTYHPCGDRCLSQALKGAVNDSLRLGDYCRENDWLVFSALNVQSRKEMLTLAKQANHRITPATSMLVLHYSGHAEDLEGDTQLLMCGDDSDEDEPGQEPSKRCHCANGKGKKSQAEQVQLRDILIKLCRKIARQTKVLVLIDGCRTKEGRGIQKEVMQTDGLKGVQLMIVYACGRGRTAHEYEINGCWHGNFTRAFLHCMRHHETLPSLIEEVQGKTFSLSGPRSSWLLQDCSFSIQGGWADYTSTPNFFRAPASQKIAEECCKIREELQDAGKKIHERNMRIVSLESEKKSLEAECERLNDELQLKKRESKIDHQNLERLAKKLKDTQAKCRNVQADLEEQLRQSKEAEIERESLRKLLDLKQEHLKKLSTDQSKYYKQSDATEEEVENLKLHLVEVEDLKHDLQELRRKNEQLDQENLRLRTNSDQFREVSSPASIETVDLPTCGPPSRRVRGARRPKWETVYTVKRA